MLIVRRVGAGDAEAMRDVALRSLMESPHAFGRTIEQERRNTLSYYEEQARMHCSSNRTTTFLLVDDDRVAGVIGAFLDENDPSTAYLCAMWIDPGERRRGAGLRLVAEALAWVQGRGARVVCAWVADSNSAARAFWSAAGFSASSTKQRHPANSAESETLYAWRPVN